VARLKADRGRVWESEAELRDESGAVCARATCKQMPMNVADARFAAGDFLPDAGTVDAASLFPDLVS